MSLELLDFPDEMLMLILINLHECRNSMYSVARTCRRLHALANADDRWRRITEEEYYRSEDANKPPPPKQCSNCAKYVEARYRWDNDGLRQYWSHKLRRCDFCEAKNVCGKSLYDNNGIPLLFSCCRCRS